MTDMAEDNKGVRRMYSTYKKGSWKWALREGVKLQSGPKVSLLYTPVSIIGRSQQHRCRPRLRLLPQLVLRPVQGSHRLDRHRDAERHLEEEQLEVPGRPHHVPEWVEARRGRRRRRRRTRRDILPAPVRQRQLLPCDACGTGHDDTLHGGVRGCAIQHHR